MCFCSTLSIHACIHACIHDHRYNIARTFEGKYAYQYRMQLDISILSAAIVRTYCFVLTCTCILKHVVTDRGIYAHTHRHANIPPCTHTARQTYRHAHIQAGLYMNVSKECRHHTTTIGDTHRMVRFGRLVRAKLAAEKTFWREIRYGECLCMHAWMYQCIHMCVYMACLT